VGSGRAVCNGSRASNREAARNEGFLYHCRRGIDRDEAIADANYFASGHSDVAPSHGSSRSPAV
jgi:hypothetical protein